MNNKSSHISAYNSLLKSIDTIWQSEDSVKKDKVTLSAFADKLSQLDPEVGKFGKVSKELQNWLVNYDFAKGLHFEKMQAQLEALHPLRLQLVKMGEEARQLSTYPDRYDSKKAVEICRGLMVTCLEKMSLDETNKLSKLVESNTKKLVELQRLLERDNDVLNQINTLIETDKEILTYYKVFYVELMQYVDAFPHSEQNDLEVVKERITAVKKIHITSQNVEKKVAMIQPYCDRYNKGAVVSAFSSLRTTMATTMRYGDIRRFELQLRDVMTQVTDVNQAFDKEQRELESLRSILQSRKPEVWKEDNEKMLTVVTGLLNRDTRRVVFSIDELKTNYSNSILQRQSDISDTKRMYPWLESRNRYKIVHDSCTAKYIESMEYHSIVNNLRKERIKRIILWCIPVIGWLILMQEK